MNPLKIIKILICRGAFGKIYEPAWFRVLKGFGHDVSMLDIHEIIGKGPLGRLQEHYFTGPGVWKARRRLVEDVHSLNPDITLLYQGHYFGPETIKKIKSNTFLTGYHNDDPFGGHGHLLRYRALKKALPLYDGFHVYRKCNVEEIKEAGVKNVALLMPYYIPWIDYPRALKRKDKERYGCDIVFAGHPEQDARIPCLGSAAHSGLKVRVFGYLPFWQKWLPTETPKRIQLENVLPLNEYRIAICSAKISACFFSKWNRDQYTRRVFEIPACGGFLLAERTPVMKDLYKEGKEAEYFESPEEFVDKAKHYIKHEAARKRICIAGRKRLLRSGNDIYSRMKQWVADVERWRHE